MEHEPAVQLALARKRELEAELREIDTFLELYRKFAKKNELGETRDALAPLEPPVLTERAGSFDTSLLEPSVSSVDRGVKRDIRSRGMSQLDFERMARDIALAVGRPIYREELLAEFHKMGRHLGTGNELANLKTKLWRATADSKSMVRIPGSGYWPKDVPCPAVNYVPEPEKTPI